MALTVSMSMGRVAIGHDIREEISANVDKELIYRNDIFVDKLADYNHDLVAYTDARFQPLIDQYNVGKKPSRQIKETYTEHIAKENAKLAETVRQKREKGIKQFERKPRQLAYEYVLQIGDRETNSALPMEGESPEAYAQRIEDNRQYFREILDEIQAKYAHCDILLATFHADEPGGTLHVHMLVQFVGDGYKKGLEQQVSVSRALECDGFVRNESRKDGTYAMTRWIDDVKDSIMTPVMEKVFDQERLELNEHRKHQETWLFRQNAIKEAAQLEEERELTRQERELTEKTHSRLDGEIERKKEYTAALDAGGSYTNEAGEVEHVRYEDSIRYMESTQDRLKENVEAYKSGGFYYDYEKKEGVLIPSGGVDQLVADADQKNRDADQHVENAKAEAGKILEKANEGAGKIADALSAYESAQKTQIDLDMQKYAEEQKKPVQAAIDALNGDLEKRRGVLNTINSNITSKTAELGGLEEQIADKAENVRALDADISQKGRVLDELDTVMDKIGGEERGIHAMTVPNGLFGKRQVTVVEDMEPGELERVFDRADVRKAAEEIVQDASKDAQKLRDEAAARIAQADAVLQGEAERRRELDAYEKRIKEKNATLLKENKELEAENRKSQSIYRAYANGWKDKNGEKHPSLEDLKQDYKTTSGALKDVTAQLNSKIDLLQADISPDVYKSVLEETIQSEVVYDIAKEALKQLDYKGHLKHGWSSAFQDLSFGNIRENVKDKIVELAERARQKLERQLEKALHPRRHIDHGRTR